MTDILETTLTQAHTKFTKFLQSKGRAHATILAYGKDIEQLIDFLAKNDILYIKDVSEENLRSFLENLGKNGYTKKSISRKINSIKTFYRFLITDNIITDNPATYIKHPKIDSKEPRVLSRMEYRALRDACRGDKRICAIVELFLQTGIRIGELAQIKLEDIKEDKLIVRNARAEIDRTIPLNSSAASAIKSYLAIRPNSESDILFITKTGRPLLVRNIRTAIDRYFREAGIRKATINDLRNTFIAHQLASNAPLEYVSQIVGHKRVSTTEKYLDLVEKTENKSKEPMLEEL